MEINRQRIIQKHWPLFLALIVFWLSAGLLLYISTRANDGHLIYALDDAYIHMAMAKSLAQHGVWGITPYEFSSSSSSLLWTAMLSGTYIVTGANELAPFVLNILFASALIITASLLMGAYRLPSAYEHIVLLAIIFLTSLVSLVFTGMEHVLHALVTIAFVYFSVKVLSNESRSLFSRDAWSMYALTFVVPATRYEGLFLVFVVSLLLILRRRLLQAVLTGMLALIPVALYGIISLAQGWSILPSTLLLKGRQPDLTDPIGVIRFVFSGLDKLTSTPHILLLLAAATLLYLVLSLRGKRLWDSSQLMLAIFGATTFLHLLFAQTGWFFRYEAYLIALGILVIGISASDIVIQALRGFRLDSQRIPQYMAVATLVLLLAVPFARRGFDANTKVVLATTEIYGQQYQMGMFLRDFYQGSVVAANDVGAISYLADVKVIDLFGLGNAEIASLRRDKTYSKASLDSVTRAADTRIAIIYDDWFRRGGELRIRTNDSAIPTGWTKVGEWKSPSAFILGGRTVSFYALSANEQENLANSLRLFAGRLPTNINQSGKYLSPISLNDSDSESWIQPEAIGLDSSQYEPSSSVWPSRLSSALEFMHRR